ncbi:MAG: hypothetical protein ACTSYD_07105, partial [Candidatus Heimdallarchaeaceae archaeon]
MSSIRGVFLSAITDIGPDLILLETQDITLNEEEKINLAIKSMPVSGKRSDYIIVNLRRCQIIAVLMDIPPFGNIEDTRNTFASLGFIIDRDENPVEYRKILEKIVEKITKSNASNIQTLKSIVNQLIEALKKNLNVLKIELPNNQKIRIELPKHVQKLIFINVGVYVGSMSYFQILNPHRVKEFLKVNEP